MVGIRPLLLFALFCVVDAPASWGRDIHLFTQDEAGHIHRVPDYRALIDGNRLQPGDAFCFPAEGGGTTCFPVIGYMGDGAYNRVFHVTVHGRPRALRISRLEYDDDAEAREDMARYAEHMRELETAGVAIHTIHWAESHVPLYLLMDLVPHRWEGRHLHLDVFLFEHLRFQKWPGDSWLDAKTDAKLLKDLRAFARSLAPFRGIGGDFTPHQILHDGRRWVLVDVGHTVEKAMFRGDATPFTQAYFDISHDALKLINRAFAESRRRLFPCEAIL